MILVISVYANLTNTNLAFKAVGKRTDALTRPRNLRLETVSLPSLCVLERHTLETIRVH